MDITRYGKDIIADHFFIYTVIDKSSQSISPACEIGNAAVPSMRLYYPLDVDCLYSGIFPIYPVVNLKEGGTLQMAMGHSINGYVVCYYGDLIFSSSNGTIRPFSDNATDLGATSYRYRNVRAMNVYVSTRLRIPTSAPASPANGDIWMV
jgi:hypothetical protein